MAETANRLLIVDDDETVVDFVERVATGIGFSVARATDAQRFIEALESFSPSVILLDLCLPQTDGVELMRALVARGCNAQIVVMSGADRRVISATADLGKSRGLTVAGRLSKPIALHDLRMTLASVYQHEHEIGAADLERALARDEIVAYYQPKACLLPEGGWRVDGVEALARWQHPDLGLVMPDEFIGLAEREGLIGELTNAVLRQALAQLKSWDEVGLELRCAVNLSPSLVVDLDLPDRIAGMIAEGGVDASRVQLELTESATMLDPTRTMDILTRLRVKRIGLSLDDFGTGYSSLTRLYQLPFDEMKIDKSLVMNVPRSREANTIVGSLIDLGHSLGLRVCAEGVESRAALDVLEILRCDRVQGYFLSRAVPAGDLEGFVMRWNSRGADAPARAQADISAHVASPA